MTKKDKLENKLKNLKSNFTWNELTSLAKQFNCEIITRKGSRRLLFHKSSKLKQIFHEPHPGKELKIYQKKYLIQFIEEIKIKEKKNEHNHI
ncbi:MAG: type II toxin-antitoxin system HicA family toxin [Victivallales bacterium]|nr:type II toxin-antitoxin system HicA family toxin [Victivallales bacterium]